MAPTITFVIPVRHQDNAADWLKLKSNLASTLASISAQTSSDWRAVVVANRGADLPPLPAQVSVCWVDFPPNKLHDQGTADKETFYEAIRIDKGRRVLSGMLHAGPMKYVMVVDDDDFVSNKLVAYAAAHPDLPGWYIHDGYLWGDGDPAVYRYAGFSKLCGTSHIIQAALYRLPASLQAADDEYIKKMLGSHIYIHQHLIDSGTPLLPLPFAGAIYRVGYAGAHSKSTRVFAQYFGHAWLLWSPGELLRRLARLRLKSRGLREEYFGERPRA
jgi:hypothetical protein